MTNFELKFFEINDIDWLIEQFDNPLEQFYWTANVFQFPLSKNVLIEHLKHANFDGAKRFCYKYTLDNAIVGYCELNNIDYTNQCATISRVVVDKKLRGKQICYNMLKKLLNFAFYDLKLHRVELIVLEDNFKAIECYKKLDFRVDGLLRDTRKFDNKFYSAFIMSILGSEFVGENS